MNAGEQKSRKKTQDIKKNTNNNKPSEDKELINTFTT